MDKCDPPESPLNALSEEFIRAVSGLFECLGRALICLDRDFQIVHASEGLDGLVAEGTSTLIVGELAEEVLGQELFGESGTLRRALEAGERREGWGATLVIEGTPARQLSISVAPVGGIDSPLCDPRVAYLVVARGSDDPATVDTSRPTIFSGMVGRAPAMLRIFQLVQNLAESDATVLLTGESGTGKELVARAVHLNSPRCNGPFVAVNCGAIPGELLETELFGHVRGAFTGAVRDREGRFETASGGSLFLDEVGDLPLPLQVKLLRVLQDRTFERVGENVPRTTEARIIAATHLDLHQAVMAGAFREDLYYRLRVVPIHVPPLRERREEIEPLTHHLLARVSARNGRSMILGPDATRALMAYSWPGNVRELENSLEYAVAVGRGQTIHAADLPDEIVRGQTGPVTPGEPATAFTVPGRDQSSERERVRTALDAHRWNRAEAAKALGMSRTTLWRKMRELGLTG